MFIMYTQSIPLVYNLSSCAFLPNNGGFFVGYIIFAALIGTSLEWVRIVTFVQYVYWRFRADSSAQRAYASKVSNSELVHVNPPEGKTSSSQNCPSLMNDSVGTRAVR